MRSLVIVVPDEIVDGAASRGKREEGTHMEAFVVDGANKSRDFAVGMSRIRTQEMVRDPEALTVLLKSGQAIVVEGMPHRKGKRVVRQHGFNRIWQRRGHLREERGGGGAGLLGRDPNHGFTTEVIDGGKFEII